MADTSFTLSVPMENTAGHPHTDHSRFGLVKTGDILLFSSWSITSLITKAGTFSHWTHAGIAVWLETKAGRLLYVFEAGTDDEFCALNDKKGEGCRLVCMDQIDTRYTRMAVRNVPGIRDKKWFDSLHGFMREYVGKPFRNNTLRLAVMNMGFAKAIKEDAETIFCSELAGLWLKRIGVLSDQTIQDYPPYRITPANFAEDKIWPINTFPNPPLSIHDNGVDGIIVITIFAIQMCSLFMYILFTVDDEGKYRSGHRRRKQNRRPSNAR
jgi:hypothetical protein